MDKLTLKYGKTSVSFSIKNKYYEILKSAKIEPASDPEQYLASVIDKPLGCPPLDQIFFADFLSALIFPYLTQAAISLTFV